MPLAWSLRGGHTPPATPGESLRECVPEPRQPQRGPTPPNRPATEIKHESRPVAGRGDSCPRSSMTHRAWHLAGPTQPPRRRLSLGLGLCGPTISYPPRHWFGLPSLSLRLGAVKGGRAVSQMVENVPSRGCRSNTPQGLRTLNRERSNDSSKLAATGLERYVRIDLPRALPPVCTPVFAQTSAPPTALLGFPVPGLKTTPGGLTRVCQEGLAAQCSPASCEWQRAQGSASCAPFTEAPECGSRPASGPGPR